MTGPSTDVFSPFCCCLLRAIGSGKSWPEPQPADGRENSRLTEGKAHHQLKGVGRLGLRFKVGEGRRQARFTQPDLDQEPRHAVFHHHKIHFAFLLVAQIAQLEVANPRSVQPSTAFSSWQVTKVSARARSSASPLQSRWNHFGSCRRALAAFVNHGRIMSP